MREARVRDAAQALRQRLNLGHGRVDPFDAMRLRGVEVVRHRFDSSDRFDGLYRVAGGRAFVLVNTSRAAERQRFTAAHELGHHELDGLITKAPIVDVDVFAIKDPVHQEKNWFAGAFLVDEFGVNQVADQGHEGEDLLGEVISVFDVSVHAAAIELRRIGLIGDDACSVYLQRAKQSTYRARLLRGKSRQRFEAPAEELDPNYLGRVQARYERGALNLQGVAAATRLGSADAAARWLIERGASKPAAPQPAEEDELLALLDAG